MKSILKRALKATFPGYLLRLRATRHLIKNTDSYLCETGWMRSLEENIPLDRRGNPIPWMNYPVIAFLRERMLKDVTVFEFGSGYSTLFFAARAFSVTSVEYDREWLQRIKDTLPANAELILQPKDVDGEYCRSIINTGKKYDVVVIDGRDRINCLKQSVGALTDQGIILLDDSSREEYLEGIHYLTSEGFSSIFFEGLKPMGFGTDRTTIFYRPGNCLEL